MIIKKRSIKSNEEVIIDKAEPAEAVVEVPGEEILADPSEGVVECPYEKAISCIRSAIDELGLVAKDDPLARESIANLSVVLFDLKC